MCIPAIRLDGRCVSNGVLIVRDRETGALPNKYGKTPVGTSVKLTCMGHSVPYSTMNIARFYYPESHPALHDIVIAEIKEIRDVAIYGTLPAYGNLEFMMPTSEVNVRRGKRVGDYVHVGDILPTQVISISGGKIDTSMKLVRPDEAKEALDRFHKSGRVHNIVRCALGLTATEADIRTLYTEHLWPRVDDELFSFFEGIRGGVPAPVNFPTVIITEIMARLPAPVFTASSEHMIRFGQYHDGLARLNAELKRLAALEGIQVHVLAPPKYRLVASAPTQEEADARLAAAVASLPNPC